MSAPTNSLRRMETVAREIDPGKEWEVGTRESGGPVTVLGRVRVATFGVFAAYRLHPDYADSAHHSWIDAVHAIVAP